MELILEKALEHQQKAVDAVGEVFDGIYIKRPQQYFENPSIDVKNVVVRRNIARVQDTMNVHAMMCWQTAAERCLNIDIKMETGTGKTYVYVKTIYELHKRTGVNKFIVAVPTLPIKAGAEQFMGDNYVLKHFQDVCGYDTAIDLCVVKAAKDKKGKKYFPASVRDFVNGTCQDKSRIYVLLVNMGMLTGGKMLTRDDYDYGVQGFYRPMDAIAATKPIVIIDEPHRFSRDQKAYKIIEDTLKPQCIIRYGATFPTITVGKGKNKIAKKDYVNLLYDLDACDAFNHGLIKGVAKEHFEPTGGKNEKVKIVSIAAKSSVTFMHKNSTTNVSYTMQKGDSLGVISEELSGLTIEGIGNGYVEFSNGQEKQTGEEFTVDIYSASYQEQMVRLAIQRHFETEKENFNRQSKIKTLALFFIDNIESYRGNADGKKAWLKEIFNKLLRERIEKELKGDISQDYREYLEASREDINACSAGYFAQDNSDTDEAVAQEVNEILHNKKKLLSFKNEDGGWNVRRFLFSKWTLKEGWDNPNVFTITKLRSSGSENSKIQEVGRGLRLPVDEWGTRISNEEFLLNYIVDFTEKDFADKLVAQINGQRPQMTVDVIHESEIERVAELRGVDAFDFMKELRDKKYIMGLDRKLDQNKLLDFYNEYPEFYIGGIGGRKVIDRNKNTTNKVKIRKAQYEELKELWAAINKKYVLFFSKEIDAILERELPKLIKQGVFSSQVMSSQREMVKADESGVQVVEEAGVQYMVEGRALPYNTFVKRLNKATSIPIITIHNTIRMYVSKCNDFRNSYFNETTLSNFISVFNDWKSDNMKGKFSYKQTQYTPNSTALTYEDGTVRDDVVQGNIGAYIENGDPHLKYLYDTIAYDSPLERKNIMSDFEEIVVYGKIPRRSIAIPTIADSSYSPDFMYVVRKKNGDKELNIVVETKDVEGRSVLRPEEANKISCAEKFFEQLKLDGYTVHFRTQLNNKEMIKIVGELMV